MYVCIGIKPCELTACLRLISCLNSASYGSHVLGLMMEMPFGRVGSMTNSLCIQSTALTKMTLEDIVLSLLESLKQLNAEMTLLFNNLLICLVKNLPEKMTPCPDFFTLYSTVNIIHC